MTSRLRFLAALPCLLLAACGDNRLSVDVTSDAPATLAEVWVPLKGIELEDENGNTTTLNTDSALVNLADYSDGALYALLSDADIDSGNYVAVRLRFGDDSDAYVVDEIGDEHDLAIVSDARYADLNFSVEGNDSSSVLDNSGQSYALVLGLDLRLSLARTSDGYTLDPVLRAVQAEDAATLEGTVSEELLSDSDCQQDRDPGEGVAVYVFQDADIEPDDYDGADAEPFATALIDVSGSSYTYGLDYLPAGDYTVALTCQGDEEDAQDDDDLSFTDGHNLSLDDADSVSIDFN